MTEYFLLGNSMLSLHFFDPNFSSGVFLVVIHPATIVSGHDLAVIVRQNLGLHQNVAGGLDEVGKVNLAPGSHVVHTPHVHAGCDGVVRPLDLPQASVS